MASFWTGAPFDGLDDVRMVADDGANAHVGEVIGDLVLIVANGSVVFVAPVGGDDDCVGILFGDFNEAVEGAEVVAINDIWRARIGHSETVSSVGTGN